MEVWDPSSNLPHLVGAGPLDVHGRGLVIVQALADDWGTCPAADGGKVVWAALAP
jgi:hypothetical protein